MSMNKSEPRTVQDLAFWNRTAFQVVSTLIALAIVPLFLVLTISLNISRQALEENSYATLNGIAEQKLKRINEWIDATYLTMTIISENSATFARVFEDNESTEIAIGVANNYMASVANSDPHIKDFFVYDLSGRIMAASSPRFVGRIVNRQPYFTESFNVEDFRIEPPYFDVAEGNLALVATDIIEGDNGEALGVIAALLDTENLNAIMIDRTGLGETGETYLVSQASRYLLTPSRFEGFPQNRAYFSQGIDAAMAGEAGFGIYPDYRGLSVIGNYRYIPELELALIAEIDASEGFAALSQVTNVTLITAVVIALLAVLVSAIISRQQSQSINNLTEVATAIANGDLKQRLSIKSNTELGILAQDFNIMADNLSENIDQLNSKFREVDDANKQLRVANAKAKEATRLKSEFLANMSHELRTPLNAIIGFTGIMLEGFAGEMDADANHMVKRVYDNSKSLLTLINDILDIAKIESGRLELVKTAAYPDALADQWRTRTSILAEQKGLSYTVEVDSSLPQTLYVDTERLSQVAINLLSNAIKFTQEGGIKLQMLKKGHFWQIVVSDTGIGIPPHAQEYIFDEFRQVDGSSMRSYGGTGLGLAITRKLVLMMGGTISVESVVGKGSKFIVALPIEERPTEEISIQAETT
jgi:signal transduction histidine kinase